MESGKLRHRLQIQSCTETRGTDGAIIETWSTISTVHASVMPITSREFFSGQQLQTEVTHKIRMRYTPLTKKHRILFGARVFDIESIINPGERNRELEIMAVERDA